MSDNYKMEKLERLLKEQREDTAFRLNLAGDGINKSNDEIKRLDNRIKELETKQSQMIETRLWFMSVCVVCATLITLYMISCITSITIIPMQKANDVKIVKPEEDREANF